MTAKQARLLKSLRIDAHDAIIAPTLTEPRTCASTGGGGVATAGAAAGGAPAKVYHYRGAVYELQGDEPDEWMDAEREISKKRQSRVSWDVSAGRAGLGGATEDGEQQTRKKRRRSEDDDDDDEVDAGRARKNRKRSGDREEDGEDDGEQPRRKSRSVALVKGKDNAEQEQEQARKRRRSAQLAEARAIKKRKRSQLSTNEADDETHDQRKRADSVASVTTRALPAVPGRRGPISEPRAYRPAPRPIIIMKNPGVSPYDMTTNGGHETETCSNYARMASIREARDRAANEGLQVRMLGEKTMAAGRRWHVAQLIRELMKVNQSVKEHEDAMAKLKREMDERKRRESMKAASTEDASSSIVRASAHAIPAAAESISASASATRPSAAGDVTARPSSRIDSPLASITADAPSRTSKSLDTDARPASASHKSSTDAPSRKPPLQGKGNRSIVRPTITAGRAESLLRGGRFSGESVKELAEREQEEEAWLTGWMTRGR
ncbi:hypothetical protein LTR82_013984 [Friedmanniomyces endolithicus]|uniref:Uncharacterized protein n=1 Tax=Friedmanniomyces endolithicus TaxID=329885 RepID=A0AAN6FAY5_9PEZI|nr:hypothetical protein LTR82_013984 [Friedmanniomyces endolithicus]